MIGAAKPHVISRKMTDQEVTCYARTERDVSGSDVSVQCAASA